MKIAKHSKYFFANLDKQKISKNNKRQWLQKIIRNDYDEYWFEQNEVLCGCNCMLCNPYYGDIWEYEIMRDEWQQQITLLQKEIIAKK
jgi:hypothetical protein